MSRYTVYVTPSAWDELKDIPGHIRQRVRRAIAALADEPRPAESKALVRPNQEAVALPEPARELRRIRLERWRIVYAIQAIDVLTVRKRPPYDYGDLERLLAAI